LNYTGNGKNGSSRAVQWFLENHAEGRDTFTPYDVVSLCNDPRIELPDFGELGRPQPTVSGVQKELLKMRDIPGSGIVSLSGRNNLFQISERASLQTGSDFEPEDSVVYSLTGEGRTWKVLFQEI
jgi:hypothetical protein